MSEESRQDSISSFTRSSVFTRHFGDADSYLAAKGIRSESVGDVWGKRDDWEWDAFGGLMTVLLECCGTRGCSGVWRGVKVSEILDRLGVLSGNRKNRIRLQVLALWWQCYGGVWPKGGGAVTHAGKIFGIHRATVWRHLYALERDPVFGHFLRRERKVKG